MGIPSGISLLVCGIRTILELHPHWVVVRLDLRNAYNEVSRAAIYRALVADPRLQALARLFYATHSGSPAIYLAAPGQPVADFTSDEGAQQGDALASAGFCAALHPAVREVDEKLAPVGGAARFDMDDGFLVGPPAEVFAALATFESAFTAIGLELQRSKSKCYSPQLDLRSCPHRPSEVPLGGECFPDGTVGWGVMIGGVPVGDDAYVRGILGKKAQVTVSKTDKTCDMRRDAHLPALWTSLQYALQPRFHHWVQHCYPSDALAPARLVDEALLRVARVCVPMLPPEAADTDLTFQRLRLPARWYGGGVRSVATTAPAAFLGMLCRTLPKMLDSATTDGDIATGFLTCLTPLLGHGSFDRLNADHRFQSLVASGSRLGTSFAALWSDLQGEVGDHALGILDRPAEAAGKGEVNVQRALNRCRERARYHALDASLRALAPDDPRSLAWLHRDRFSTAWVGAWFSNDLNLSTEEFHEVASRYLGLPSPACSNYAGARIAGCRLALDQYGFRLSSATLPGDGWRQQHDELKWRLFEDVREMGMHATCEVYGLFSHLVPQVARGDLDALPLRQRQALVPDLMITCAVPEGAPLRARLFEIKTLHVGSSTYPPNAERCSAVARRARAIQSEYLAKARKVDQDHCGTAVGTAGPVERRLRAYGDTFSLVFGAWGEASADVDRLLSAAAEVGAYRHHRLMGASDPVDARGALAWLLRRRWGIAAVRANARLTLGRLSVIGRGATTAADRRSLASQRWAARQRTAAVRGKKGPRLLQRRHGDA